MAAGDDPGRRVGGDEGGGAGVEPVVAPEGQGPFDDAGGAKEVNSASEPVRRGFGRNSGTAGERSEGGVGERLHGVESRPGERSKQLESDPDPAGDVDGANGWRHPGNPHAGLPSHGDFAAPGGTELGRQREIVRMGQGGKPGRSVHRHPGGASLEAPGDGGVHIVGREDVSGHHPATVEGHEVQARGADVDADAPPDQVVTPGA